jgi:hypothetical protein
MTRFNSRARALVGAVLLLAPVAGLSGAVASSAGAATTTHLLTCAFKQSTRPTSYILSCADANAGFIGMKWSTWGSARATGHGVLRQDNCTPNCAAGKEIDYVSNVTLYKVVDTKKYGPLFSEAVFHYRVGGKSKSETFGVAD